MLSALDCAAAALSADASLSKGSNDELINHRLWSIMFISSFTLGRNSNGVSVSGRSKVSLMREVYLSVMGSQTKMILPVAYCLP